MNQPQRAGPARAQGAISTMALCGTAEWLGFGQEMQELEICISQKKGPIGLEGAMDSLARKPSQKWTFRRPFGQGSDFFSLAGTVTPFQLGQHN